MQLHPAAMPIELLLADCEIKKTRRGGPGGQHRNKVESAIVITHFPTQIIGQAGERRSQHENRSVAIGRLRQNLALGVRLPVDSKQSPSPLWQSRVTGQRISVSLENADFPALLAEALDFVSAVQFDIAVAADRLFVTSSQLLKFLKTMPPAFQWVNDQRCKHDLKKLK